MTKSQQNTQEILLKHMDYLKLSTIKNEFERLSEQASNEKWPPTDYLKTLLEFEVNTRQQRAETRRIKVARFPVIKTLDQFRWNWPDQINEMEIKNLFRLQFLNNHTNIILLGGVGLGKTHLATALGYHACLSGINVLFINAVEMINNLTAAQTASRLKLELKKYLKPQLLILDELGYLPIDKTGADHLFQIISQRYEKGSTIITSNRVYKDWPKTFNNDSTLTSALLDRLLHHAISIVIKGKSYRMKDIVEK